MFLPSKMKSRIARPDAWKAMCNYVDELADSGAEEFSPREALGAEHFANIHTLPESIAKLKRVTKVWLYGSKLKRIPPEIGEMTALTHLARLRQIRGTEPCSLCGEHNFPNNLIASCELWIPSNTDGFYFATPSTVIHYIQIHGYRPPQGFLDSVLQLDLYRGINAQDLYYELIGWNPGKAL